MYIICALYVHYIYVYYICIYKKTCTKKSTPSKESFSGYAKILITRIPYRIKIPEEYLEPSRTSTMELFCKKQPSASSETLYSRCSNGF